MSRFLGAIPVLFLLCGCPALKDEIYSPQTAVDESGGNGNPLEAECGEEVERQRFCGVEDTDLIFRVNSMDEDITVESGQSVSVSWIAGALLDDCRVSPGDASGGDGSFNSDPITEDTVFTVSCQGPEQVHSKSVTVFVRQDNGDDPGANMVEFRIPSTVGSSADPFNTAGNAVNVKVGDTLRIHNDSDARVRIHTSSNRPFPHGADDIPKGQFRDYTINQVCTANPCPNTYNHYGVGSADFFINVMP